MIEVDERDSPGYWLVRCVRELEARQPRLQELEDRLNGDGPLPVGAENVRAAYRRFQKKARTNFAEKIVQSRTRRMKPLGFRTAAAGDENGDALGRKIWDDNGLDVEFCDVAESMVGLGDSYMIVGGVDPETGSPVITGEDPTQVITIHDPAQPRKVLAAAKVFHDPDQDRDLAYLYLPAGPTRSTAQVWVAYRDVRRRASNQKITFAPRTWSWDEGLSKPLPHSRVPVVRFRHRKGVGVFENHTDLLDRIDHQVLSRLVIAAMQAYRQRAMKGAPQYDEQGKEINYEEIFVADPGAMWDLPEGVDLWESQTTDLTPILSAVSKDFEMLSAVVDVPLAQFVPSAVPQSAEGASLAREGLVFAVEDTITRANEALRDVMSLAFLTMGDDERAERSKIEVMWLPPERLSLAEKADAVSKVKDVVPKRTLRTDYLQHTPQAVERMEAEDAQQLLLFGAGAPGAVEDAAALKANAESFGALVRAGVEFDDAAQRAGLPGLVSTGAVPVSLRFPEEQAAGLEGTA